MALPASAITAAGGKLQIMLFKSLSCQLHSPVVGNALIQPISATFSPLKSTRMELLSHPSNDPPKFKTRVEYAMKKLREVIPDSLQKFPWAEAESIVTKELLTLLQEALKWSLVASFVLGSLSDIIYTISRNKEFLIPPGLFSGCVVAEFLKETSGEYLQYSQQESGKIWHLLGMGCFFVLIRIIVTCCSAQPPAFLLHAANGGFMHVLWQWKISSNTEGDASVTNVTLEDASITGSEAN